MPKVLTEMDAMERARQYAEQHGRTFRTPVSVRLERQLRDPKQRTAGHRYIDVLALGTWRPVPLVDVDAETGEVLAWRSLPR